MLRSESYKIKNLYPEEYVCIYYCTESISCFSLTVSSGFDRRQRALRDNLLQLTSCKLINKIKFKQSLTENTYNWT